MTSLGVIALCLTGGHLLRRFGVFGERAHETLSDFVIWISVPALTFVNLRKVSFEPALLSAALSPWIVLLGSWAFFRFLGRAGILIQRDVRTITALTVVCGLGNTSFVGFPLIEALIGPEGIPVATIFDQLGSFLAVSTVGVTLAAHASSESARGASPREVLRRVLRFPPFIALVVTLLTRPLPMPEVVIGVAERLASTLTPLALTAVGCQLTFTRLREGEFSELTWGLGYKLLVAPLLILLILLLTQTPRNSLPFQVSVLESAMAPMISGGLVVARFGLRPSLTAKLVAYGTLVSFWTVPFWSWLIRGLASL